MVFGLILLYAEPANASYLFSNTGFISVSFDAVIFTDVYPFLQSPQKKPYCGEAKYAAKI